MYYSTQRHTGLSVVKPEKWWSAVYRRAHASAKKALPAPLWAFLRKSRVRLQARRNRATVTAYLSDLASFVPRQVRHVYGAHTLDLWIADPTAEQWYDCDWPEPREISLLRSSKLKPGAVVINAGAHQCVLAVLLAREVGPTGLVVAAEANAHNVETARRNRALNRCEQLLIEHAAVSDRNGQLLFSQLGNGSVVDGTEGLGCEVVRAVTIDALAVKYGPPDVVYCDVEGHEGRVLGGARETLACQADWCLEIHGPEMLAKYGDSVESVLSCFPQARYRRLVASDSPRDFIPLELGSRGLSGRFFFLALHRH
jgi:FkbM family methyltransferase